MRIDLPQCNFKNCRYYFDGNCTNRDKYNCCDYRSAKINAIKEFAENIKAKSDEKCPFCKMKDELDENEKFLRSISKRNSDNWTRKATVALVDESYCDGKSIGSATYNDYELNFCPVCGKPFKANEK